MVGGASTYASTEKTNSLMQNISFIDNHLHFMMQPDEASEHFRYFIATNHGNHEVLLYFFNLVNENRFIKEGVKILYDSIQTNMRIYVPMLAPIFTLEESHSYDSMDDEQFENIRAFRGSE